MGIVRFAIDQPITVAVGAILVALFGLVSLNFVPIQLTPDIDRPRATVLTTWPGASPFEIEREIIDEQEEQLKGLDGLLKMESESQDGFGQIMLEFPVGTDPDSILVRVSNRLEQVPTYPPDVDKPVIFTVDPGAQAMAWFMIYADDGYDIDPAKLSDYVDDFIKPPIERVPGVAQVNLFGGREREMQVVVDPKRLAARGLTMSEVAAALAAENKDYSAGDFREGKRRYVVRTAGDYRSPEEVENVIVATSGGAPVHVRDIGRVQLGYRKPTEFVRALGRPALAFNAQRAPGSNVLDVMARVRVVVERLNEELLRPQGLRLDIAYQETDYIDSAIALVRSNIFVGGALALIVLLLFLRSLSGTFVVGLSIPISMVATFLVMALAGRSINVISLAGLAFAVGMVVDNCIVVLENVYRHRQMGKRRMVAALDGAVEVWGAVLASTLTTVAVFLPVIFVRDEAGQLFRDIALAVSASVLASLVTAMTLIPTLSARILGGKRHLGEEAASPDGLTGIKRSIESGAGKLPTWIAGVVGHVNRSYARRIAVIAVLTSTAIGGSWLLMPDREYLPAGNSNFVIGIMSPPPGYSPEEIGRIGDGLERELLPRWQVEPGSREARTIEGGGIRDYFFAGFGSLVFIGMRAKDPARSDELVPLLQELLSRVPGTYGVATQWSIFETDATGGSINLDIRGDDLPALIEVGGALLGRIYERIPGSQVLPQPSLDLANPEIRLVPDRRRMADVGLTNRELGFTVDALVDGAKISDYRIEGREIDLVLVGDDDTFAHGHDLDAIPINTPSGKLVTLGSVARIEPIGGPTQVNHHDRQRAIRLQVTPPRGMPLETAINVIRNDVVGEAERSELLPPGVVVQLSGTADDLTRTARALSGNFVLAIVVTYLLMAALFQSWIYPLVIMFSVPLATFGGFVGLRLAHAVTGQNLDVLTMLGFVILIGIVVNNAILIVHQALNLMRGEGRPAEDAIPEAVRTRVRPIFMSTATSIFGMLPLVLFPGAGSELYRGLGSVVIGGLALSTVFTLVLVPSLFSLVVEAKSRLAATIERRRHAA
ncbi:MAG TPA: efflux RND transporter permease subunit [Candidatus Polarisedimenticolaceae bacterium]|nr:efflux RND transporter permease subunit [Candidatus Polarisedimenticolaceae bacterium]